MMRRLMLPALFVLMSPTAEAGFLVRIGDIDGFGYGAAQGFRAARGGPANASGSTVIGNGDFLPDLNRDDVLATGSNDEFDLRSAAEIANTSLAAGAGVTDTTGTLGSSFTDISLARSFDERSAVNRILTGVGTPGNRVFGPGGPFPSPPSSTLPNQPGFVFRFNADASVLDPTATIFFNLIFGDFDVVPAEIRIRGVNGVRVVPLIRQGQGADGLIQAATANLNFSDVFTRDGAGYRGELNVNFVAPNEPYTAFDYVELSTTSLVVQTPAPSGLVLLGSGAVCLLGRAWRRKPKPSPDQPTS